MNTVLMGILGRGIIMAAITCIATDLIYYMVVMLTAFMRMTVATAKVVIDNKDKNEEELDALLDEFIETEGNKIVLSTKEEFDFLH